MKSKKKETSGFKANANAGAGCNADERRHYGPARQRADFAKWLRMDLWRFSEVASLLCGLEPIGWREHGILKREKKEEEIFTALERSYESGRFATGARVYGIPPCDAFVWAKDKAYDTDVPQDIIYRGLSLDSHKERQAIDSSATGSIEAKLFTESTAKQDLPKCESATWVLKEDGSPVFTATSGSKRQKRAIDGTATSADQFEEWHTVDHAADLVMRRFSDAGFAINRNTVKSRISYEATKGNIKSNGEKGRRRRIDPLSMQQYLDRWVEKKLDTCDDL